MKVKALKSFISTVHGSIETGEFFDCDAKMALQWAQAGMVEPVEPEQKYDTKVERPTPVVKDIPLESGKANASGSSQAAQASPKKTQKSSRAKKR